MSIIVKDSIGVLTPAAKADLEAGQSPFRVKVLFESTSKPELQAHVHACVDTPNTLCVGVDPGHRFTWTEIGIDTGIKSGDYQQVGRAGSPDFAAGRWADGVKAIISRGAVLSQRSADHTAVTIQQPTTVVEHSTPVWPIVAGFGVLVVIIWALVRKLRRDVRQARTELQEERGEYLHRNVDAMTAPAAPTPEPPRVTRPTVPARPVPYTPPTRAYAPPVRPAPVMIAPSPPIMSGPSFTDGVILGSALRDPAPAVVVIDRERLREPERRRHRERTPTPAPSYTPSYESAPSPSYDSSPAPSDSGGGGGGDFGDVSGGGGGGDF
jgi:uncharacterized membrane protein YgcG